MREPERMQQAADVIAVIADAEALADQLRDAGGGPNFGPIAVGHRALQQQLDQALPLADAQLERTARREPHAQRQAPALVARITPSHHRDRCTAQQAADLVERPAFIQEPQRAMPSCLENRRPTLRSHDEHPPWAPIVTLFMQQSISKPPD